MIRGAAVCLAIAAGAFAQEGSLTGLVKDSSGRRVPNATVTATSTQQGFVNPARSNFDMGLFKRFPLKSETRAFEFRAEAFNVFNHTQWSGIYNSASCYAGANNSAGGASCIASQTFLHPNGAHNPRILQLGLKLLF